MDKGKGLSYGLFLIWRWIYFLVRPSPYDDRQVKQMFGELEPGQVVDLSDRIN